MTRPAPLEFRPGDLAVEVLGSVVRFWAIKASPGCAYTERLPFQAVAESRTIARHRYLFRLGTEDAKAFVPAAELTSARLYPKRAERWPDAARAVREALEAPQTATVHFFYSSWGPSGAYWNMPNLTGSMHVSVPGTATEDSNP